MKSTRASSPKVGFGKVDKEDATAYGEEALQAYSDMFEEVILCDKQFGPTLRMLKTAYDAFLQHAAAHSANPVNPSAKGTNETCNDPSHEASPSRMSLVSPLHNSAPSTMGSSAQTVQVRNVEHQKLEPSATPDAATMDIDQQVRRSYSEIERENQELRRINEQLRNELAAAEERTRACHITAAAAVTDVSHIGSDGGTGGPGVAIMHVASTACASTTDVHDESQTPLPQLQNLQNTMQTAQGISPSESAILGAADPSRSNLPLLLRRQNSASASASISVETPGPPGRLWWAGPPHDGLSCFNNHRIPTQVLRRSLSSQSQSSITSSSGSSSPLEEAAQSPVTFNRRRNGAGVGANVLRPCPSLRCLSTDVSSHTLKPCPSLCCLTKVVSPEIETSLLSSARSDSSPLPQRGGFCPPVRPLSVPRLDLAGVMGGCTLDADSSEQLMHAGNDSLEVPNEDDGLGVPNKDSNCESAHQGPSVLETLTTEDPTLQSGEPVT